MPEKSNTVGYRSKRESPPTAYVIAGPNGAGKTTFASSILPNYVQCREFLNADLIAAGLAPFAPETTNVRAGRLLLSRIDELTAERRTFGFETTLAGRSYARRFAELRKQGYRISLFFLWLPNPELAISRVANRVRQGGHHVPEPDIRRRFRLGIRNLLTIYRPIVDEWKIYDATTVPPKLVVQEFENELKIVDQTRYDQAMKSAGTWPMTQRKNRPSTSNELEAAAFLDASYQVVETAKRTGTPVILWRDGKIVKVPPEEIVLPPRPKRPRR